MSAADEHPMATRTPSGPRPVAPSVASRLTGVEVGGGDDAVSGDRVRCYLRLPGSEGDGVLVLGGRGPAGKGEPRATCGSRLQNTQGTSPVLGPQAHPVREHVATRRHHDSPSTEGKIISRWPPGGMAGHDSADSSVESRPDVRVPSTKASAKPSRKLVLSLVRHGARDADRRLRSLALAMHLLGRR